ncbi:cytochrome c [Marinibactrum halimedae]|uniref:Cytochrome c n=1 Tax=Marinibactrum halimedae TaxID=1444977 RepID=A0AA37WP41_9GAMM|nr:cytochrome c [Marinibactrum halimedae]
MTALSLLEGCTAGSSERALTQRAPKHSPNVVVIGGGFAGATCARVLAESGVNVVLVDPSEQYVACPMSNLVIASLRNIEAQTFQPQGFPENVTVVRQMAQYIDAEQQQVTLEDGVVLNYDRLVLAPGIDLRWSALEGYDTEAAKRMPHAWKAGPQTLLLRDQLRAMPNGGTVVMSVPANPYRCPPGPYERASLIAHYLKTHKPRSKLIVLDAKDRFSKQSLFQRAWKEQYSNLIEWQGLSDGAQVVRIDAKRNTLHTDFDEFRADVANVIPPQQAGSIAITSDIADASGWCPIQPATFESTRVPNVHIIGDAAIANAMPKSAFAANAQAKLCAIQVTRLLSDQDPLSVPLINTCYSLINPNYGISVADVYQPTQSAWSPTPGAGGVSATNAPASHRQKEADYAHHWFKTITQEAFGSTPTTKQKERDKNRHRNRIV